MTNRALIRVIVPALIAWSAVEGARADFVRLFVHHHATVDLGAGDFKSVFRVYAEFTNPTDRVNAWHVAVGPPTIIENFNFDGGPGSGFYNPCDSSSQTGPCLWDTFPYVGAPVPFYVGPFIAGNSLPGEFGVFITTDDAQGRANFINSGADTDLRVLLIQLTVNSGEQVRGIINVNVGDNAVAPFDVLHQSFTSLMLEPCEGDIVPTGGNGSVSTADLLQVINDWGLCQSKDCPADLTGDGAVGTPDLLAVLNDWGPCW